MGGLKNLRKGAIPPVPCLSPSPLPFYSTSLSSPIRNMDPWPLNQLGGLGSAVSSPSWVRGRAPAENEFGTLH